MQGSLSRRFFQVLLWNVVLLEVAGNSILAELCFLGNKKIMDNK